MNMEKEKDKNERGNKNGQKSEGQLQNFSEEVSKQKIKNFRKKLAVF